MLALVYKIITAIIALSHIVGEKSKEPIFKARLLELIVYPILLIGLTIWIIFLLLNSDVMLWDVPSILAIVAAQEAVIDTIVIAASKKVEALVKGESEKK